MAGFSQYLANQLLKAALGQASYNAAPVYIALCTTVPTDAVTGAEVTAGQYTGYARASIGATGADFGAPSAGVASNAVNIVFPACTGGTGASIVAFQAYDAFTGGNPLWWGTCSLTVNNGLTPRFSAGQLQVTLT